MKVGILTFHNSINYGAVLQCYALKEFLTLRGHDVQVIDYRNAYVEDYAKLFPKTVIRQKKGIFKKLKSIVISIILYTKKRRIAKVFMKFADSRFNKSIFCRTASEIPSSYDCIVFGSDQIWNHRLCGGYDPAFFGQFPKGRTTFVAYAASIGNTSLVNEDDWQEICSRLRSFDAISVREIQFKQALEQRLSVPVDNCIDPTLLGNPNVFSSLAIRPQIRNYIFLYNVKTDNDSEGFAIYLAKETGCKVVIGQAKPRMRSLNKDRDSILVDSATPEEFLGYIMNAKIVIGNSFHVIALAIIFGKNFYSLESNKSERVLSLLSQLDLLDRHVKSTDRQIRLEDINYKVPTKKLEELRKASVLYLSKCGL